LLRGIVHLLPNIVLEQVEEIQLVQYAGTQQGFGWHEDVLPIHSSTSSAQQTQQSPTSTMIAGGQRIATCLVYLDECDNGRTIFRDLIGDDGSSGDTTKTNDNDHNNRRLAIRPKIGRALLFFPAVTDTSQHKKTKEEDDCSTTSTTQHNNDHPNTPPPPPQHPDDEDALGEMYNFDNTRADHRTVHAGEPPGNTVTSNANDKDRYGSRTTKHIAQLWIHSLPHTPVVFGRGLNLHSEAKL
jgi:hypothetical protein